MKCFKKKEQIIVMQHKSIELASDFKLKVVGMYEEGVSCTDIEKKYNLDSSILNQWIKKYKTTGSFNHADTEMILGETFKEYQALCLLTYDEAVEFLLEKYGPALDDYYREKSYYRYMNNEIKTITKGKFSRTNEGLYCHHIDENKIKNISDKEFIKHFGIPYAYQKKDRLVYCDLIEHCILHGLIAKESDNELGVDGLEIYLIPIVEEWYINEYIPKPNWMKNCYNKAFLTPENAESILVDILNLINVDYLERIKQEQILFENRLKEYEKGVKENLLASLKTFENLNEKSDRKSIVCAMRNLQHGYTCYENFNKNPNELPNFSQRYRVSEDYKTINSRMIQFSKEQILQDALELIDRINSKEIDLKK